MLSARLITLLKDAEQKLNVDRHAPELLVCALLTETLKIPGLSHSLLVKQIDMVLIGLQKVNHSHSPFYTKLATSIHSPIESMPDVTFMQMVKQFPSRNIWRKLATTSRQFYALYVEHTEAMNQLPVDYAYEEKPTLAVEREFTGQRIEAIYPMPNNRWLIMLVIGGRLPNGRSLQLYNHDFSERLHVGEFPAMTHEVNRIESLDDHTVLCQEGSERINIVDLQNGTSTPVTTNVNVRDANIDTLQTSNTCIPLVFANNFLLFDSATRSIVWRQELNAENGERVNNAISYYWRKDKKQVHCMVLLRGLNWLDYSDLRHLRSGSVVNYDAFISSIPLIYDEKPYCVLYGNDGVLRIKHDTDALSSELSLLKYGRVNHITKIPKKDLLLATTDDNELLIIDLVRRTVKTVVTLSDLIGYSDNLLYRGLFFSNQNQNIYRVDGASRLTKFAFPWRNPEKETDHAVESRAIAAVRR